MEIPYVDTMRDEVPALRCADNLQLGCLVRPYIVAEQAFAPGICLSCSGVQGIRRRVPLFSPCRVAARDKGCLGRVVYFDILACIGFGYYHARLAVVR